MDGSIHRRCVALRDGLGKLLNPVHGVEGECPDTEYVETFQWTPDLNVISKEFWADEAVGAYKVSKSPPALVGNEFQLLTYAPLSVCSIHETHDRVASFGATDVNGVCCTNGGTKSRKSGQPRTTIRKEYQLLGPRRRIFQS